LLRLAVDGAVGSVGSLDGGGLLDGGRRFSSTCQGPPQALDGSSDLGRSDRGWCRERGTRIGQCSKFLVRAGLRWDDFHPHEPEVGLATSGGGPKQMSALANTAFAAALLVEVENARPIIVENLLVLKGIGVKEGVRQVGYIQHIA
jgi:hypothetical protein